MLKQLTFQITLLATISEIILLFYTTDIKIASTLTGCEKISAAFLVVLIMPVFLLVASGRSVHVFFRPSAPYFLLLTKRLSCFFELSHISDVRSQVLCEQ
ncbi:hypothetical protein ABO04_02425 [Nitrosomonas sp. HPC101]|nr:hypothetical protein [Nitrosomonas sp. HPC101]